MLVLLVPWSAPSGCSKPDVRPVVAAAWPGLPPGRPTAGDQIGEVELRRTGKDPWQEGRVVDGVFLPGEMIPGERLWTVLPSDHLSWMIVRLYEWEEYARLLELAGQWDRGEEGVR